MAAKLLVMPKSEEILPDKHEAMVVAPRHVVNGNPTLQPFPENMELAMFGMGCFWGAERIFWRQAGVYSTQVGYSSGFTRNPTYEDVCTGRTGHAEVVRIIFDPKIISYENLLQIFWENHDPTLLNCQGCFQGTQYRSGIYYYNGEQKAEAESTREKYDRLLQDAGHGKVVTEIKPGSEFYYAEDYHQQYLHKNPDGYCDLKGTGVRCSLK